MKALTINPSLVITPILIAGLCLTQFHYDTRRLAHLKSITTPYNELIEPTVPDVRALRIISLGHYAVMADLLWLITIQYYGGGDPYGRYRTLPKLVRSINTLDSRFKYPYEFAGLVLPNEGFPDEALSILKDGEKSLPNEWLLPYYEGTIYYVNKKDYVSAAESYKQAATKPGAPDKTEFLSAVQFDRSENYQTALAIFQKLAEGSENSYFKERAKAFVEHYTLLTELQKVIDLFSEREGRHPHTLNELIDKHYVNEMPADPLGRELHYDQESAKVTADVTK